jgi:PAS domain S-box-containing protein
MAAAAQIARLPLHPPTLIPYVTYLPFVLFSAAYGGFWPGLLTTVLCFLEALYFSTEPIGSFAVRDPRDWFGLNAFMFTAVVGSFLFERVKKARLADAAARELAALLNQTYDAVFVWKLDGMQITFWDQGAITMYGYSGLEALGRAPQELLATQFPESLAACLAAIRRARYWEGELVQTARDGRRITVEARVSLRQGDDGQFSVIEVARDITARKRLEQTKALLAREQDMHRQTLESIIQNSPACIALMRGPYFTYESVNPAYQALIPGERIVGRTVADVWPEAAPLLLPLLKVVREAGTVYHATEALIPRRCAPDGPLESHYFDFFYVPVRNPVDDDVLVLVDAVEVTAYKRVADELRASNLELTTIYAHTPVALMVLDGDLRVRKANDMACEFATPPGGDPVSQRPGEILRCLNALADPRGCGYGPACPQCRLRSAALDSARNGISHKNVEAWIPVSAEGGVERRCLSVCTGVIQPDGERLMLVSASDVTQLKKSEAALSQTVRELESALAGKTVLLKEVHHRVKNNLAVISSLLSMKADTVEAKEAQEALEESQQRVFSIALIHEQLYGSDHLDHINFLEYARQLVGQLQSAFVGSPERIGAVLDVAPIEMGIHRAVPCALILNELVSNAFKHAFPGARRGEVLVSFRESSPGFLELAVEDNGIGSPPGATARNTRSLGLEIVGILSRQLEGSIEQQAATGAGTRFVLRFPAGSSRRAA